MADIVARLKALSDETRLRIINLLYEKELCVCDITETLSITQTKASRHLGVLRNAGLVDDRKNAQWVYYSLKESNSTKLLHNIINELLRKESLYNDDLNKLYRWLEVKNNKCD